MAGLFFVQTRDRTFADSALAVARKQFALHGSSQFTERAIPGWHLIHAPYILGGPDTFFADGEDFVAVMGTPTCDGKMGRAALQAMLSMDRPDWDRLGGPFVALVHRQGRTRLFTDYLGLFQIFHDSAMTLFSTSLLAAANALPRLSFDVQGVYELAFNVVPLGNDSVFAELKTLGPDALVELGEAGARVEELAKPLPDQWTEPQVAPHVDKLMEIISTHVREFGDRIHCALSGGIDSRLMLAALRAAGSRPQVYVYGGTDSDDVAVSRAIAAAEGFHVEWLDKEAWRTVEPDAFPEQVEANYQGYDGLANYGELFENGANAHARALRHPGGALAGSAACAEVFRNFFFLPNRRFRAVDVARAFFARYAKSDVTEKFDEAAFLRGIEDKMLAAIGRPGDRSRLPRPLVEQIYPRVRCRALFGREISLETRIGPYMFPFLDHQWVAGAMTVPLGIKHAGRFESMMLKAIDPVLAAYPSVYGHDFAGPPNLKHRFSEWATRIRPMALRQRSYALRRRLGPVADEHGGLLTPEYMGRVIDLDYPAMRRFFRIERIADSGLMRRISNLEYLAKRLGSKLAA